MKFGFALLTASVMACAACGSAHQIASITPAGPSPLIVPTASATTTYPAGPSTDHAVPMVQYPRLRVGPQMPLVQKATGDLIGPFGVTPEGQAIVGVIAPDDGGTKATQGHIELMDPGADHGEVLPEKTGNTPRGIEGGATADAHTVVWAEGSSTDITNDNWVIEAYDRDTHQTRVIAAAADGANTPTAPHQTIPYIAHGRVY